MEEMELQRLQALEARVSKLEAELAQLKSKNQNLVETQAVIKIENKIENKTENKIEKKPRKTAYKPVYTNLDMAPVVSPLPDEEKPKVVAEPQNRSLESFIGKHGMAIGASLLIFIAMVMFAMIIVPLLGDTFKIIAMFVFSFAFIIGAEIHSRKKGINKWNTALLGCGAGAIFVSLFVTYIYFNAIDVIPLYVLLVLWSGYLCYLSKKRSIIFAVIGQLGIVVAVLFSSTKMGTTKEFIVVFLMLMLSEASFLVSDYISKNYWNSFATWLGTTLSFIILSAGYQDNVLYAALADVDYVAVAFTVFGLVVAVYTSLIQSKYISKQTEYNAFAIQSGLTIFPISVQIATMVDADFGFATFRELFYILFVVLALGNIVFLERIKKEEDYDSGIKNLCQIGMALVSILGLFIPATSASNVPMIIGAAMIVVAQLLAVFAPHGLNKTFARFYGIILMLMIVAVERDDKWTSLILLVIMSAVMAVDRFRQKEQENIPVYDNVFYVVGMGILSYIVYLVFSLTTISSGFIFYIEFIVLAGLQLLVYKKKFSNFIVFTIVNGLLVIAIWLHMSILTDVITCTFDAAVLALLLSINVKDILKKFPWAGAYVAFKYSWLCFIILKTRGAVGVLFSIVFLIMAIISITVGFRRDYKSMRLYGLVLSIISIIKLILVDISYSNLAVRALGFLVCGLLCFVISFIYNRLDKSPK